ncbi:rhamnogalacturonan acetylesterase [Litchfieldia salsa]|uniref:Lysophospholipase L1 n=1 Tax=Litchfieldia salsa TaxID=930152 RepID=A0A1H0Q5D8_9BACI|nr:rhamnogalacturonan acetylesterase [Litchfieldia salsa]SDP11878.1 Lysophospholipase L1 [Litchfieldia salsa]
MSETFLFDFGTGEAFSGYTKVTEGSVYNTESGFGFIKPDHMYMIERDTSKPLFRDFCIPLGNTFIVDVPNGIYTITVMIGDTLTETETTIKYNDNKVLLRELKTYPKQFVKESFTVNVNDGQIKLTFLGGAPRINAMEISLKKDAVTMFLAGDSTVTDQPIDGYPYAGWGQCLPQYIKADAVVINHAISGRSSKSFIDEGHLETIWNGMKVGDFLLIQFGHNDQKPDKQRHTEPFTTYKENLKIYINGARQRGATPILITPVHRRNFDEDGKIVDTHGDYILAMKELAHEENVRLVDLAEKSKNLFEKLGPVGTKRVLMWGVPGEFLNFPKGVCDNTHFQEYGANKIAQLVAEGLKEFGLHSLSLCLKA